MMKREASLLFLLSASATECFVVAWAMIVVPYVIVILPFALLPDVGVALILNLYGTAPDFVKL